MPVRVAVAMSGGVDSSVAAWLLRSQGCSIEGGSFAAGAGPDDPMFARARALCQALGVPWHLVDLRAEFQAAVVDRFVDAYRRGLTPNPCVGCNPEVKFGLFAEAMRARMRGSGAPPGERVLFATGHYARIGGSEGAPLLLRGRDPDKDQSYMLYRLSAEQLASTLFPLGGMLKGEVRAIAEREGFESAGVRESQDACFVEGSYIRLLAERLAGQGALAPGDIRGMSGALLGRHGGYARFTIGQRSGLGLGSGPWHVARIDPSTNTVFVGRREEARSARFEIGEAVWRGPLPPRLACTVKVRYRSRDIPCSLEAAGDRAAVELGSPDFIAPGQSAVFYDGEVVLGGGVIARPEPTSRA